MRTGTRWKGSWASSAALLHMPSHLTGCNAVKDMPMSQGLAWSNIGRGAGREGRGALMQHLHGFISLASLLHPALERCFGVQLRHTIVSSSHRFHKCADVVNKRKPVSGKCSWTSCILAECLVKHI